MVEMLKRRVNVSVKIYELFFSDLKIIFSHVEAEACGKIKCGQGLDFLSLNIIIKAYTSFYISCRTLEVEKKEWKLDREGTWAPQWRQLKVGAVN